MFRVPHQSVTSDIFVLKSYTHMCVCMHTQFQTEFQKTKHWEQVTSQKFLRARHIHVETQSASNGGKNVAAFVGDSLI